VCKSLYGKGPALNIEQVYAAIFEAHAPCLFPGARYILSYLYHLSKVRLFLDCTEFYGYVMIGFVMTIYKFESTKDRTTAI
jgi:hypothetical protein